MNSADAIPTTVAFGKVAIFKQIPCEHVSRLASYLKNYNLTLGAGSKVIVHCDKCDAVSMLTGTVEL
jgi:hypothetical protein